MHWRDDRTMRKQLPVCILHAVRSIHRERTKRSVQSAIVARKKSENVLNWFWRHWQRQRCVQSMHAILFCVFVAIWVSFWRRHSPLIIIWDMKNVLPILWTFTYLPSDRFAKTSGTHRIEDIQRNCKIKSNRWSIAGLNCSRRHLFRLPNGWPSTERKTNMQNMWHFIDHIRHNVPNITQS